MHAPCRIVVMAKAPVAGHAKTRLIPALGAQGAAALAERLLDHAVQQALAADLGPVELCGASAFTPRLPSEGIDPPAAVHPAFERLADAWPITLSEQGSGDLGQRMHRAFERAFSLTPSGPSRVLLTGTDAPALDASVLRRAAEALADTDAVFVPAHDGGYALVGLRRPAPTLFTDMVWSTPTVMARTRGRIKVAGLRHTELPPLHDIDVPADLIHLPTGWLS